MSVNRISANKYALPFFLSWLAWSSVYTGLLLYLGMPANAAIFDSIIFNGSLLACAIAQVFLLQYYFPKQNKTMYILVASACISLIVTSLCGLLIPISTNGATMFNPSGDTYYFFPYAGAPIRFSLAFLLTACFSMINILIFTLQDEKATVQRKLEAEKLSREAELFQLRSQLQPHFLFNSLNSISALAGSKPEVARQMIQQLSDFLRGTIKKDNNQLVTLEEELKHLHLYLDIEKVRFGHRLQTEIVCPDACRTLKLPSLLLQPVLENAIKFGLYGTLYAVTITIQASCEEPYLFITIANPFDKDTQPAKGTGFGLTAVSRRLYLLYARTDLVKTDIQENIFITTLTIPQYA